MFKFLKKVFVFILVIILLVCAFIIYQGHTMYEEAISKESIAKGSKNKGI